MDKECECKGLSLLTDMMSAYDRWLTDIITGEPAMGESAKNILSHLQDVKETEEYREHPAYTEPLSKMREAVEDLRRGKEKGTLTLEIVRDMIHQNDSLKQMMICGPPHKGEESEMPSTAVIREAFHLLAEADPEDAIKPLKKRFIEVTCGA